MPNAADANSKTLILVGHCGPDVFMLRSAIRRAAPGSAVKTVNSHDDLQPHLGPDAVLLVNRVLDGRFDHDSGVELIRALSGRDDAPTAILISDLPDAQDEARDAGAAPGFGKRQLYEAETTRILAEALAS